MELPALGEKILARYRRLKERILPRGTYRHILYLRLLKRIKEVLFLNPNAPLGELLLLRYRIWKSKIIPSGTIHRSIYEWGLKRLKILLKFTPSIPSSISYSEWIKKNETSLEGLIQDLNYRPIIILCMEIHHNNEDMALINKSVDSVLGQNYQQWKLYLFCYDSIVSNTLRNLLPNNDKIIITLLSNHEEINQILYKASGEFIGWLKIGNILRPYALQFLAHSLNVHKTLDIIYSDHDHITTDNERIEPFFKPDWSPDLFLSMNYLGSFFILRKSLFEKIGGLRYDFAPEELYDLLLRATENTPQIYHIPKVLYSQYRNELNKNSIDLTNPAKKVLQDALERRKIKAEIIPLNNYGNFRIKYQIIGQPKISIIMPTAFRRPRFTKPYYLETCLKSITKLTSYPNYEILIIDNSHNRLKESLINKWIDKNISCRIIKYDQPYHWSAINNLGAKESKGDYLLFLNDDIEVISPEWLEAMLEHSQRPEVGVVGAKLIYPDRKIQHGGIIFTNGVNSPWLHTFRYLPGEADGYWGFLKVVRNYLAVTGACFMVSRKVFQELGGFDIDLVVEYNDIDFCLRAHQKGYRIVWTPFAVLVHHEAVSRKDIYKPLLTDRSSFWKRWSEVLLKGDPFYNPNLSRDWPDFSLIHAQMKPDENR